MRMSGFLLGGLVGAAVVLYMKNNNRPMLMSALGFDKQSMGKMAEKAKHLFSETGIAGLGKSDGTQSAKGLSTVKEIINKDPHLKTQVDEIMNESQNSSS